uniref:Uncharacterized protein n=1 Tax=Seriola dumerili TaxID=41447 RepID=A0A3B4ULV0_SERDU
MASKDEDGEQPHPYGAYAHPTPHGHGHETAAQRYSATRIQAGYEPERCMCTNGTTCMCTYRSTQNYAMSSIKCSAISVMTHLLRFYMEDYNE